MGRINWGKDRARKQTYEALRDKISEEKHKRALANHFEIRKPVPDWIREKRKVTPKGMVYCANRYCVTLLNKFKKGTLCDFHKRGSF